MLLDERQCAELSGGSFTAGKLFLYMAITAMGAAIFKILFSRRGKVSFAGLNLTCGN